MSEYKSIEELKGQTLTSIEVGTNEAVFETKEGKRYLMYHEQDCCESVTLDSVEGDKEALLAGEPITFARDEPGRGDESGHESVTFTDFVLETANSGRVVFHWTGSSNGYYSESVYFVEIQ